MSEKNAIFAIPKRENSSFREHSSVGLEHLPYKQRVGGSTPSAPTEIKCLFKLLKRHFSFIIFIINFVGQCDSQSIKLYQYEN